VLRDQVGVGGHNLHHSKQGNVLHCNLVSGLPEKSSVSQTVLIRILKKSCEFGHAHPRKRIAISALQHVPDNACMYTFV